MRYLFFLTKAYSSAIVQPLCKLLEEENRDWAVFTLSTLKESIAAELNPPQLFTNLKEAFDYSADYVLSPENRLDPRLPGVKVQLFHGLGVEKKAHFQIRHFYDLYLTSGPYVTERFLKAKDKRPYFEVKETGWLKIDAILGYETTGLRERYEIPKDKRIILYAPTFSRSMQSASKLAKIIPFLIKEDEYWLFKFHPLMPKKLIEPYKSIDDKKARIIAEANITPFLHLAEVMLSDTSSVVYEFYALGKPVITFRGIKGINNAINVKNAKELRKALDACLSRSKSFEEGIAEALAKVHPYQDGKVALRTLEALDSIKPADFPKANKPKNLFRQRQIIKRMNKLGA